jgi:hypothetical protein
MWEDEDGLWELGLHRILREPHVIAHEATRLSNEIEEVAVKNCGLWVTAVDAAADSTQRCITVRQALHGPLEDSFNRYKQAVVYFDQHAKPARQSQVKTHLIQDQFASVMDVLELPHLMMGCVRAGTALYDDVIDLWSHAVESTKNSRAQTVPKVIQQLMVQVNQVVEKLKENRLLELETDRMQLTHLLKLIGHLRRLNCFTDVELQQEFLNRREKYINKEIAKLRAEESNHYLLISKLIDFYRVFLFEVIAQFNALFMDDAETPQQNSSTSNLHRWVSTRIELFLQEVDAELQKLTDSLLLGNILRQGLSAGLSLASVGTDFRPLFTALIDKAVLQIFTRNLQQASSHSVEILKKSHFYVSDDELHRLGIMDSGTTCPVDVLRFPSLAALYNDVMNAISDFSSCAPLRLYPKISIAFESSFSQHLEQLQASLPSSSKVDEHRVEMYYCIWKHLLPLFESTLKTVFKIPYEESIPQFTSLSRSIEAEFNLNEFEAQRANALEMNL